MNKFYVSIVVCLLCASIVTGQTFYWVGPSGGNWNSASNWASISGGAGGAGIPDDPAHNVIFDQTSTVIVDLEHIGLNTLSVTNNVTVKLVGVEEYPNADSTAITVYSADPANPGLNINTGSRLEDSCFNSNIFTFMFAPNARGNVAGTWYFRAADGNLSTYSLPLATGFTNRLDINGNLIFGPNSNSPGHTAAGDAYLFFNSGSVYQIASNLGTVPRANYNPNSTILITGLRNSSITVVERDEGGQTGVVGNVIVNSPNMNTNGLSLNFQSITINGDFTVENTNNFELYMTTNGSPGFTQTTFIDINGDLTVSETSKFVLSTVNTGTGVKTFEFRVGGNLEVAGTLDLRKKIPAGTVNQGATQLFVAGNINQTGGSITATSPESSNSTELYVIEMNGSAPQTIFSQSGSFDNVGNQVTLRINNASGVTLLSPLAVGRLSFNSVNKGILTTTAAFPLTINSTVNNALAVNSAANNGYVNGPVRRRTAQTVAYPLPTGAGGFLRTAFVIPSTTAVSTWQAQYFRTAYSNLNSISPLNGVTPTEYWEVSKVNGTANAAVQLTLNGAVPGAQESDAIVVAKYNGSDWVNARGTTGAAVIPGTSTSGTVSTEVQTVYTPYTLGYGLQTNLLPIFLESFNARRLSATSAEIVWEIGAGSTPRDFEVLRSSNGRDFSSVSNVAGSETVLSYRYVDNTLPPGTSYYRLKMTDIDGTVTYSSIVAVINGSTEFVINSLMPTLVTSRAKLSVSAGENSSLQTIVTDLSGRIVHTQLHKVVPGSQDLWLNLQNIPAGAYQLSAFVKGTRVSTTRFVKK
jgi:hypothetical protein